MRLIDADELVERVWRGQLDTREGVANMIKSAPTVDAEPVVRCKDCKWWFKDAYSSDNTRFCFDHGHHVPEDYFCATGEKEESRPTFIVHCKECVRARPCEHGDFYDGFVICEWLDLMVPKNGFCFMGERKKE